VPHFWPTLPEAGILTFGTVGQSMLALPGKFEPIKHGNIKPTKVSLVPGSQSNPPCGLALRSSETTFVSQSPPWQFVAIVRLAPIQVELGASSLSMIRSAIICGVALAFCVLGSHGKRADLGWLAYSAVALGTLRLFLEDLRFGNAASLVFSSSYMGSF
jgi:hypothetical protein